MMAERISENDADSGTENTEMLQRSTLPSDRKRDWRLFNVVLLGVSFLFLFTAFQTCSMVQVSDATGYIVYVICRLVVFYLE